MRWHKAYRACMMHCYNILEGDALEVQQVRVSSPQGGGATTSPRVMELIFDKAVDEPGSG